MQKKLPEYRWYSPVLSPFVRRHQQATILHGLSESETAIIRDIAMAGKPPVIIVKNSKAGCTTLAQILYYSQTNSFYDGRIHEEWQVIKQGPSNWHKAQKQIKGSDRYLLTSVRDPRDRAYSAFRDFFLDKKNPSTGPHLSKLIALGFDCDKSEDYNLGVFLDYVQTSLAENVYGTDRHWREQHINTAIDTLDYDLIINVERFAQQLPPLLDVLKIPAGKRDEIINAKFNKSRKEAQFGAHHRIRIETMYAKDMDVFNY